MTSQTNLPLPPASFPAPVAAPPGPRERRVRFGHLALAIALVVVGALGTTALVTMASAKGAYLALARDVEYGTEITEQDLVTVRVNNPGALDPVPAGDLDRMVGSYATMPLAKGTLLTEAHVTDQRFPTAGEVRLGITVPDNRLPARRLEAGNLVLLVDTDEQSAPTDGTPVPLPRTWQATVVGVTGEGDSGSILGGSGSDGTTIDVLVGADEAPIIASLAANNHLSVAVLPGRPGS